MSSTEKVSKSVPPVILHNNYVNDEKLEIIRHGTPSEQTCIHPVPSTFPTLKTFAQLAYLAYYDHHGDGSLKVPLDEEMQLDGFQFLAAAKNSDRWNGYYGIAYVNEETRQIILSHRGTDTSTLGALYADLIGIGLTNFVPQVFSAMTFAHKVVDHALRLGYEFFFTGHSLGAWLAQITTFSTMYLTLDEGTGHFVGKQSPHSDLRMPYTVVFDSPGAFRYLTLLKQSVFPLQGDAQEISVEALPVEVFLFHPNPVNWLNVQIGRVFILDVAKATVDTKRYFGKGTHGMGPVVRLLREVGEEDAVKWRVTDYRMGLLEMVMNWWDGKDRTVPFDKTSVPLYFFSREEREFLEGVKRDFPPGGQFEGVNLSDEDTASSLLMVTSKHSLWKMTGGEESEETSGGWDRREFIPRVRHIVRCLKQRGTIWWNTNKSQLPMNFVDRRTCKTSKLKQFTGALYEFENRNKHDIKPFSASSILGEAKSLVLLVDPPGMGKSSAMTKLEMQLRSKVSLSPRVIVRLNLNLNQVQHILLTLKSQGSGKETSCEPYNSMCFIEKFVKNIRLSLLQQTFPVGGIPLYVLLDGLDEVCPLYKQIMTQILQSLLSDTPQGLFSVKKIILTTRPHLQTLVLAVFQFGSNILRSVQYLG